MILAWTQSGKGYESKLNPARLCLSNVLYGQIKAKSDEAGYSTLHYTAKPMISTVATQRAARKSKDFHCMRVKGVHDSLISTYPGK